MARKVKRSFRSARTDMRKRSKYPIQRKRKKPAFQKKKAKVPFGGTRGIRQQQQRSKRPMTERTQCQTTVNGHVAWVKAKDRNGNPVIGPDGKPKRYPAIVGDDAKRCESPGVVSRMRNGTTEHKCAKHVGVWYVDEEGRKRNYDNEVVGRDA